MALALLVGFFAAECRPAPWLWLPVGMLLGGAIGNLIDRVREGAVIDFIDPVAWPAFNLADAVDRDRRVRPAVRGRGPTGAGLRFRAGDRDAGARLDAALAAHGVAPSRAAAARLIDAGAVTR